MKLLDHRTNQKILVEDNVVNIYLCGPTVYDEIHIGNLRAVIYVDLLINYFKLKQIKYFYVQNITDIDDKIIQKSLNLNKTEEEVSGKYLTSYMDILKKLNITLPHVMPLVSDYVEGISNYIEKIIEKKVAYKVESGVYLDVKRIEGYGDLSHNNIDNLKSIEENSKDKKNEFDFALWKNTNDRGIKFDSKFGKGRPGWHTECSFFINKFFNNDLTIKVGGIDLVFPHHENERAQNLALTNKELSKIYSYVGHVSFNNQKMSKSKNNVIKANETISKYSPTHIRALFLTTNFSKPIDVKEDTFDNITRNLNKISNAIIKGYITTRTIDNKDIIETDWKFVMESFENNLNITNIMTTVEKLIKNINKGINIEQSTNTLFKICDLLKLNNKVFKLFRNKKNNLLKTEPKEKLLPILLKCNIWD